MSKIWVTVAVILYALGAIGQDAKVIALSPEDAKQAKFMQEQVDIAIKRLQSFNEEIKHKYTQTMTMECENSFITSSAELGNLGFVTISPNGTIGQQKPKNSPPSPPCKKAPSYHDKDGWYSGFRYSEDYKYIVPANPPLPMKRNDFCMSASGSTLCPPFVTY